MNDLKEFDISFIGLKLGNHRFEYKVDNKFFEYFQYEEFENTDIKIELDFEKKNNMFNLMFNSKGIVTVNCDITNEPFDMEIEGNLPLIVKFGEEYNNDHEEILIIPHNEYQLNVAQFIYEMVALSVPVKRIHPGVEDGTLQSEVIKKLEDYQQKKEKAIDPRWAKLKELQSDKKE